MLEHLAVLFLALLALVKGADLLVEHAARIARRFGVTDLVVGLIITSVGTSLPELASALAAAAAGSSGLVIGNVVGSNIANIGLVLGIAALVRPLATSQKAHDRDGFIMVATSVVLWALALDNHVGRWDALAFMLIYVAYTAFVVHSDREGVEHRFKDFLSFVFDFEYALPVTRRLRRPRHSGEFAPPVGGGAPSDALPEVHVKSAPVMASRGFWREASISIGALVALVLGARYAIAEAIWFARLLDVPDNLIGLSVVAVGTSLPELLVAISAARRGNAGMVLGNVLGSNIANGMLIVGLAGIVRPMEVHESSVVYTMPIMLFFGIALLYFIRTDWRIGRGQGAVALLAYIAFIVMAFAGGWA
jgi:cation:H+ antiporter